MTASTNLTNLPSEIHKEIPRDPLVVEVRLPISSSGYNHIALFANIRFTRLSCKFPKHSMQLRHIRVLRHRGVPDIRRNTQQATGNGEDTSYQSSPPRGTWSLF